MPTTNPQPDPAKLADLRRVQILASVPDAELTCIADGKRVHLNEGDFLAHTGDVAHEYWILLRGRVRIYLDQADGRETTLYVYEPGTALGELPLLSNTPYAASLRCVEPCDLLRFDEHQFWHLMTDCPEVRKAILGNMAMRFQKYQATIVQHEKMASLGVLAAGLMHELNNPGAAAGRAAKQLRENLLRMHQLTAKFSRAQLTSEQKACMFELQEQALGVQKPERAIHIALNSLNSLGQADAEEALAAWMEQQHIEGAWKLAPTLVSIGITAGDLECARIEFPDTSFSDALNWLEALVSSMQLVGTIEESIGRVSDLVKAVKSYAYEGKPQGQSVELNINDSIQATLTILAHKLREKQITLDKDLAPELPTLETQCTGLNQIWTNLLDNAIDAVPQKGHISIRTWSEPINGRTELCIAIIDNGPGIPPEQQLHIFDPFYTTKPVGIGTGLGLGIVHRMVEQIDGSIRFTSMPGQTEFMVRLPVTIKK